MQKIITGKMHNFRPEFSLKMHNFQPEFTVEKGKVDNEKLLKTLQEYSPDIQNELVRIGLLTKTISGYYPAKLLLINSIEPYLLQKRDRIVPMIQCKKLNKTSQVNQSFKDMFTSLSEREQGILSKRYLIKNPQSLETIGKQYGLSRERIRQIEERVVRKLKRNNLHLLFLFELLRLDSINILGMDKVLAINRNIGVDCSNPLCLLKIMRKVTSLNFHLLGNKLVYLQYGNHPPISKINTNKWDYRPKIQKDEFKIYLIREGFGFLTEDEFESLYGYYSEQHKEKVSLRELIIRALKLIGSPAHYSDITEKVRQIGRGKYESCSYRSVHAALNHYDEFTWVGKRGVYGLKEWGLSAPNKSLEDQVCSILRNSKHPLSKEDIAAELSKERPYFSKNSLNLILGISNRINKTYDGRYCLANEDNVQTERCKKGKDDKISQVMEEVFKEWKRGESCEGHE